MLPVITGSMVGEEKDEVDHDDFGVVSGCISMYFCIDPRYSFYSVYARVDVY